MAHMVPRKVDFQVASPHRLCSYGLLIQNVSSMAVSLPVLIWSFSIFCGRVCPLRDRHALTSVTRLNVFATNQTIQYINVNVYRRLSIGETQQVSTTML